MRNIVFAYDFGTLSCRLLAVDMANGTIVGQAVEEYRHGVISDCLPTSGAKLPPEWALQHPDDYTGALCRLSRQVLAGHGIAPGEVRAIGSDFTNCTMLPMKADGTVLCQLPAWENNPHAWVKLWKHHAAQPEAEEIEHSMKKHHVTWLGDYGNNVSSEWFFPKVLQILREAPEVYQAADVLLEAADWIVYALTGRLVRNSATLGVNCFYNPERGYPDEEFFAALDEDLRHVVRDKMAGDIAAVGSAAGTLLPSMAKRMGLHEDVVVSVGHGDSEVAACGAGVVDPGTMILVMGTSSCYQMMHTKKINFDGLCAIVKDGMVPGHWAYESGQPAVGDLFAWYARALATPAMHREAEARGMPLLAYMDEKAATLRPGESGLVALDWLNGNRSVLMDYELTGLIMGLTMATKPWEIYRALLEATAFGARLIFDSYEENGVAIKRYIGAGGLPHKSPFMMQVYADVLEQPVIVPHIRNSSALGAAVCGAVAAGPKMGGWQSFSAAVAHMVPKEHTVYRPRPENAAVYRRLFGVYRELYAAHGRPDGPMRRLKEIFKDVNHQPKEEVQ